jgi:hypothetical protein
VPARESAPPPLAPAPAGEPKPEPPAIELPPLPEAPPAPPPDKNLPPLTLAPLLPPAERTELQRGDSTMPALKTFRLPIALAAVLSAQPLAAADVEKSATPEQTAKDLKELKEEHKKSFDALMEQLKKMDRKIENMEGLRRDLDTLKGTVDALSTTLMLSQQNARAKAQELAETQALLKQVREELDRARAQAGKMQDQIAAHSATCDGLTAKISQLQKQLADGSRQAARITEGTGTIRLFNTSLIPADVVVNSRAYRLEPGETVTLANQPVGPFTYEVLGMAPRKDVSLSADRPFDIEVFDLAQGPIRTPRRPQR